MKQGKNTHGKKIEAVSEASPYPTEHNIIQKLVGKADYVDRRVAKTNCFAGNIAFPISTLWLLGPPS